MAITSDEIAREKKTLPFGWGRFGKTLNRLAEISEPDESLLATCVAMNPEYHQTGRFVPGTALSTITEAMKTTNIVLACTSKRLIGIGTNLAGGPRKHFSIPYEGLEAESTAHRVFVVRWPGGQMRIRGVAKQQEPRFLETLTAQARPAPEGASA
jgi:hypothetical protein